MKRVLIVSAILITLGATMPACAADLSTRRYTKAPAVAAPIYNWTGFYIGGHIGGAFNGDNGFAGINSGSNGQFLGGVQIGGDYQFARTGSSASKASSAGSATITTASSFPGDSSSTVISAVSAR